MSAREIVGWLARVGWVAALMASSAASPAEAGRVRGSVVDREGKPAGGAQIRAVKMASPGPLVASEGTADDSGNFEIQAGEGSWIVFALRGDEGGRAPWDQLAEVGPGKDPAPVTVRLGAPTRLRGRLLDAETGRPIAGGGFAMDDARRPSVDAQGRFEVPGLEATHHEAYPVCPGYERRRILFDTTGRPDAELELRLPKAGKVVGRVLDGQGRPVAGSMVGVSTSGNIFSGSALWERCSDDGRFSYDGRALGRAGRLSAQASGYLGEERSEVVVLDRATPAEVDFVIHPNPTTNLPAAKAAAAGEPGHRVVSGTVVGPEGRPVASALIRWGLSRGSNRIPETRTDAEGAFRLEGVPDSEEVLSVTAKGLAPAFAQVEAVGGSEVRVELKAGATIRGRVVDDAGVPIEGARVAPQVVDPRPNWRGWVYLHELATKSDRDGRFVLEGMPEGVTCDVIGEGRSSVRLQPLSASDESRNTITMLGDGAIRGRVVDPAGNPVRNFRVQVGMPRGLKPGDPVGGYFAGYSGIGLSFTRDDGEFTITGLTAGNLHRLTAVAGEFGAGEVDRVESRPIGRLKSADALTIRLGPPHSLRVRVFGPGGRPVEGARVTAIQSEARGRFQWGVDENTWDDSVTAPLDDRGWAEFPGLAFGKGTIIVRARGFSRTKLEWSKGEEEFEVLLQPESRLVGSVLDPEGKPARDARVLLSWGLRETMTVPVDEKDGRFRAEGLAPGKYTLSVQTGRTIAARPPESVELEIGKTGSKDLRIEAPDPPAPARP